MKQELHKVTRRVIFGLLLACVMLTITACGKKTSPEEDLSVEAAAEEAFEGDGEENANAFPTKATSGYYILMEVSEADRTMRFYNTELERLQIYSYDKNTYYYNRYDGLMSLDQFTPGDVVELSLRTKGDVIDAIKESDQCWEYTGIDDYEINTEVLGQNYIRIGEKKYRLSDFLCIFRDGKQSSLKAIETADVLTVRGNGNSADVLVVESKTGYIQLTGTEKYVGGYFTVGNFMAGSVTEEGMLVYVREGTYLFSAANKGYGGSEEITVAGGEITQVDLSAIDKTGGRTCEMTVTINPDWAELYIDGAKVDWSAGAFTVNYGTHSLSVQALGYDSFHRILLVNSATAKLDFDVSQEIEADTAADDEDAQAGAGNEEEETDEESKTTDSSTNTTSTTDELISTLSTLLGTGTTSTSAYSTLNNLF